MKKTGIHILGYIEQHYSKPKPVSYSNGKGFELQFSAEDEIRMGLWASDLSIYKNEKRVSSPLLSKDFLTTVPNKYDAFSYSGKYCLIPTCPILEYPSLLVIDTENLTKRELSINGALMSNQFAPDTERVLITGYTKIFVYDCYIGKSKKIEIPYEPNEIDYAYWLDSTTIQLMVSSRLDRVQRIINYNSDTKEFETFELISPGEVFGFEPLEEMIQSDKFCLFNAKGYSSANVGRLLNQWTFINFDIESKKYKLRTNVPVSGIFYSKNWKMKGIKTMQQDAEFDFNGIGITGKENTVANIGYTVVADEEQVGESVFKLRFWSKLKRMWS